jgi:hypothetical protein
MRAITPAALANMTKEIACAAPSQAITAANLTDGGTPIA